MHFKDAATYFARNTCRVKRLNKGSEWWNEEIKELMKKMEEGSRKKENRNKRKKGGEEERTKGMREEKRRKKRMKGRN